MNDFNEKDPLIDKRDKIFIPLKSFTYFFEMFKKKKVKSDLLIPQTILFEAGQPKNWYFNSKKEKTPIILCKNSDKLSSFEVCKYFFQKKNSDEIRFDRFDNLGAMAEFLKNSKSTELVCFVRYTDGKYDSLTKLGLVQLFLEGKTLGRISILQEYINNHSKANEVYYVEYRLDEYTLPVAYKFFKKSVQPKTDDLESISQKNNDDDTKMLTESKSLSRPTNKKYMFFKFVDSALNTQFQRETRKLVEFIEQAYKIRVRKVIAKYIVNQQNQVMFLGTKSLFIDIPVHTQYDSVGLIDQLKETKDGGKGNNQFSEFQNHIKLYKNQPHKKLDDPLKFVKTIYENDKEYSKQLYQKLRVEKCTGDFCNYSMSEKNRGPLAIRKSIMEEYKKHFGQEKQGLKNIAVNLPYEISNQLILKTRERALDVIEILKKNKIFSIDSNYHYTNEENLNNIDISKEYPFMNKKSDVDNYENMYKRIKICKSCFIIYSLAAKHFDEQLKKQISKDMKKRQIHSSIQTRVDSLTVQAENLQQQQQEQLQIEAVDKILYSKKALSKTTSESVFQKNKRQLSQRQYLQDEEQKKDRMAAGGSIVNQGQQQQSNEDKQYMQLLQKSKSGGRIQSQLLPNTRKDIEVNRLTLGFLNYEKLKKLYHEPIDIQKSSGYANRNSSSGGAGAGQDNQQQINNKIQQKRRNINLMEINQEMQKRKDINADAYLLTKITEEKKSLRKQIFGDSVWRTTIANNLKEQIAKGVKPYLFNSASLYYYHANFKHLRRMPKYKISTPIQPYQEDLNIERTQQLNISIVCDLMGYMKPVQNEDETVKILVLDENTAIPYIVIESKPHQNIQQQDTINQNDNQDEEEHSPLIQNLSNEQLQRQTSKEKDQLQMNQIKVNENQKQQIINTTEITKSDDQEQNDSEKIQQKKNDQPSNEIIIFMHDLFDSFFEYKNLFQEIMLKQEGKKVIMLNIPGQSYSVYSNDVCYTNVYHLEMLDKLLYELDEYKVINVKSDIFRFIGIGLGGFILQSYLVLAYSNLPNLSSIMLINSFIEVDTILKDTLVKSLEVFQQCPDNLKELPYNYFSVIVNSQALPQEQLNKKMEVNPILLDGRISIIKGVLESNSMKDRFERIPINALIIHTLKNCVVNINQSDFLARYTKDEYTDINNNFMKKPSEKGIERKTKYINGGHSLIEENIYDLMKLIEEFINNTNKNNKQ